jgi:hypothetical protein
MMPNAAISRRGLLATGVNVSAALALGCRLAPAWAPNPGAIHVGAFHDGRFARSRDLAERLLGAPQPEDIRGDASPLLARIAAGAASGGGLAMRGVTTEAVPFCLEHFARGYGEVDFESRRLDRDLFVWSLSLRARPAAA